jgi:CEL-III C-terminal
MTITKTKILGASACWALTAVLTMPGCTADEEPSDLSEDDRSDGGWVGCANQGGDCRVFDKARAVIRFGVGDRFAYSVVDGVDTIACNASASGDPAWEGGDKGCSYSLAMDELLDEGDEWTTCAQERGECDIGSEPRWVRYGKGTEWVELIRSGKFQCSDEVAGADPNEDVVKECHVGNTVFAKADYEWTDCAMEPNECDLGRTGEISGALVRYGTVTPAGDEHYTYRVMTAPSIKCDSVVLGEDPINSEAKRCAYVAMPVGQTTGRWLDTKASGKSGSIKKMTLSYGAEHSTSTTTAGWSEAIEASLASGMLLGEERLTSEIVAEYAKSISFMAAKGTPYGETFDVTCEAPMGSELRLYQFETTTQSLCLETGECSASVTTRDTICVVDPPSDYSGPRCLPTDCADDICSKCKSS